MRPSRRDPRAPTGPTGSSWKHAETFRCEAHVAGPRRAGPTMTNVSAGSGVKEPALCRGAGSRLRVRLVEGVQQMRLDGLPQRWAHVHRRSTHARAVFRIIASVGAVMVLASCGSIGASPEANERSTTSEPGATATPNHGPSTPPFDCGTGSPPTISTSTPPISPPASAQGASGIAGTTVAASCPVATEEPCPGAPVSTHVVVTDAAGTVAVVDTGADGRFRIALKAGKYTVRASALTAGIIRPATIRVSVPANRFLSLTLQLDSGIR